MSKAWNKKEFDFKCFFERGYSEIEICRESADLLLHVIKNEQMVPVTTEYLSDGGLSRFYKKRYISKRSLFQPQNLRPEYSAFLIDVLDYLSPLFSLCKIDPNTSSHGLTAYLGMPGYCMEDHTDVGDRALVIAMLYLSDNKFDEKTGGELTLSKVAYGDDGQITHKEKIHTIYPNHAKLVLINARNPLFQHGVLPLLDQNSYRYSLFMPIHSLSIANWHIPFVEDVIGLDEREVFTMDFADKQ